MKLDEIVKRIEINNSRLQEEENESHRTEITQDMDEVLSILKDNPTNVPIEISDNLGNLAQICANLNLGEARREPLDIICRGTYQMIAYENRKPKKIARNEDAFRDYLMLDDRVKLVQPDLKPIAAEVSFPIGRTDIVTTDKDEHYVILELKVKGNKDYKGLMSETERYIGAFREIDPKSKVIIVAPMKTLQTFYGMDIYKDRLTTLYNEGKLEFSAQKPIGEDYECNKITLEELSESLVGGLKTALAKAQNRKPIEKGKKTNGRRGLNTAKIPDKVFVYDEGEELEKKSGIETFIPEIEKEDDKLKKESDFPLFWSPSELEAYKRFKSTWPPIHDGPPKPFKYFSPKEILNIYEGLVNRYFEVQGYIPHIEVDLVFRASEDQLFLNNLFCRYENGTKELYRHLINSFRFIDNPFDLNEFELRLSDHASEAKKLLEIKNKFTNHPDINEYIMDLKAKIVLKEESDDKQSLHALVADLIVIELNHIGGRNRCVTLINETYHELKAFSEKASRNFIMGIKRDIEETVGQMENLIPQYDNLPYYPVVRLCDIHLEEVCKRSLTLSKIHPNIADKYFNIWMTSEVFHNILFGMESPVYDTLVKVAQENTDYALRVSDYISNPESFIHKYNFAKNLKELKNDPSLIFIYETLEDLEGNERKKNNVFQFIRNNNRTLRYINNESIRKPVLQAAIEDKSVLGTLCSYQDEEHKHRIGLEAVISYNNGNRQTIFRELNKYENDELEAIDTNGDLIPQLKALSSQEQNDQSDNDPDDNDDSSDSENTNNSFPVEKYEQDFYDSIIPKNPKSRYKKLRSKVLELGKQIAQDNKYSDADKQKTLDVFQTVTDDGKPLNRVLSSKPDMQGKYQKVFTYALNELDNGRVAQKKVVQELLK
tara:strand:+ start:1847 stop:4507 length:2661 start_codon:yes stop_codon:yes gene_type:complete